MLRLEAEASLLHGLSHRNVIKFKGACSKLPNLALVLEYVPGGSLKSKIQAETIAPGTVVEWASQIAQGMAYLHDGVLEKGWSGGRAHGVESPRETPLQADSLSSSPDPAAS